MSATLAPGLHFDAAKASAVLSPLRSDIAGFVGRTRRGPPGVAVRVTGWREYQSIFGGFQADADTAMALNGYFSNGGDVAWIVRLEGQNLACAARTVWDTAKPAPGKSPFTKWAPGTAGFKTADYHVVAASPGIWGNGVRIKAQYRKGTPSRLDLVIRSPDGHDERLLDLNPARLADEVAARSGLIRIVSGDRLPSSSPSGDNGPNVLIWDEIALDGGSDPIPGVSNYLDALTQLGDQTEVALVAMPDLLRDLPSDEVKPVQLAAVTQAEALHDRMVLLDLPEASDVTAAKNWSTSHRALFPAGSSRAAAAWYPGVSVPDPFGGITRPLREIAPSGHVCGLISRLDRQRGAQYTPANATLDDVVDIAASFALGDRAVLNGAGINLLRCTPNQGIQVWGGRTLLDAPEGRYIAHRRLIHRLVRAVRRVAEPLVFETDGPELWLALARGATTVLLEAWRAGGLQGDTADQAFQVRCDASNNPPDQRNLGLTLCEIALAPAVPMEFITLRVTLSAQGSLDVFEQ